MVLRGNWYYLLLVLMVASCQKGTSNFNDSQVFRYNEHSNITSLDPAFAKDQRNIWAVNQLYNGLVQLDDSLQVKPSIAKNWDISEDGEVYTFLLRDDVYFHRHGLFGIDSTRLVTALDFEYSFHRLLDKNVASPGAWVLQNVKNFSAISDTVFKIELKQAFPPFLGLLAMKYCSVVSREAIEYFDDEYRSNPIGTGPFQFKLWVENTKLVLRKNPAYFEKDSEGNQLPYLEAVAITFLPDKQSEFLQFIQGNLDFMKSLDASYKDDVISVDGTLQPKYNHLIRMQTGPYLNTEYLGIYLENSQSITKNKLIRKAINYGFDRVKMIKYLRNGIGTPAINGFIPSGLPSFNHIEGYSYKPEIARKLIQLYQEETGIKTPSITITTNSNYLDLCEFIQRELQYIGLSVNIDVIPPSSLRQGKATGKFSIFRASWIADYPDAQNYLSLFYSKNNWNKGLNKTHFHSKEFDILYEKSIIESDFEKRTKMYQELDQIIMNNSVIIPLYYDQVLRFSHKNIKGFSANAQNSLDLTKVIKE